MVLRGMAQMHVDDLAERFKKLVVGQAGNADIQLAWVVFYQGRMFGAYSTAELALKKITDIEHCISIDEAPVPQLQATKIFMKPRLERGFLLPKERAIQQKEFADVERNQMR
ncbi:hypothetical protein [Pseudomonas sp. D4002]|uniref:hypothetical protein n=1 Tax=Pseudomonas sp. D4002 TaxID=2738817 RepID=UPI00210B3461|nr:hypothetical protein [Pseudomonas sp. D4002]